MNAGHLYVHVPFCSRRCSYCDFAIAVRREVPVEEFIAGVVREVEIRTRTPTAPSATTPEFSTLYLGGGTPSKLGPRGVAGLIARLLAAADSRLSPDAEVTVEANPEDVSAEAVAGWLRGGITRLSLGVQSFHPPTLEWMHRTHTADVSDAAIRTARSAGVRNISVDLIYALPSALGRDWGSDLDRALALEPDHLSLYGLTVEPRTPLGKWTARGEVAEAPEERYAEEFLTAHERLTAAGYEHYEVSSYARPGLRSAHNSAYWRRVPYLGVGPSAHSFDGTTRRWDEREYAAWLSRLSRGDDPVGGTEALTAEQVAAEEVYLGLRTDAGLPSGAIPTGLAGEWSRSGWLDRHGARVRLTPEGWLRLDALCATLTARSRR